MIEVTSAIHSHYSLLWNRLNSKRRRLVLREETHGRCRNSSVFTIPQMPMPSHRLTFPDMYISFENSALTLPFPSKNKIYKTALGKDVELPELIKCGYATSYLDIENFWFSSGDSDSVIHNDDQDNVNCVIDGTKRFFMVDPRIVIL